jgi:tRNA_anti-like
MLKNPKNKKALKWLLIAAGALLLILAAGYFYFATLTHDDTASLKADYEVEAIPFIKEFEKDYKAANKKYAEKIIAVKGIVTETEPADTTMNIKMTDTTTGSYLIFAFQNNDMTKAKKIKAGENVVIKGSCSDGIYSDILGTYFVSFKRSTIEQ